MKIAYVAEHDPYDPARYSGSMYRILRALESAGNEVVGIGDLDQKYLPITRLKRAFFKRISGKDYFTNREKWFIRSLSSQLDARLKDVDADVIFAPATIPISALRDPRPLVFWTDCTFAGMVDFYPDHTNLCDYSIREGNAAEQYVLSKCALAIYSSDWAAETATKYYKIDPNKVKMVPYGANVDVDRTSADIERLIAKRSKDKLSLVFMGLDWPRKGGDMVMKVAAEMQGRGIPFELNIIGTVPPGELPSYIKAHGFISKKTAEGKQLIDTMMEEAHFLLLPSVAECCAVVLAEASSFGVPCITTNVGGITTAIKDGRNGYAFPLEAPASTWVDCIQRIVATPDSYAELARSSFREYEDRLNWQTAGEEVTKLLRTVL